MLHGFDISAYQSSTAPSGDFVFVKATEGSSYTSSRFDAQWASAKSRAKVRGAYHFARPEQSSAQHQADRLIAMARPVPGELLCLDLEASGLGQAATNAWAKAFGQRLRERAPGVRTVLYMGSSYASNGTGRGLSAYYDWWWYPQYPAAYQITENDGDIEQRRAANRSSLVDGRTPLAAATSRWPPAVSPWLPSGLTCGWRVPDIWQFTDNFGGLDASITALTVDQLAAGGQPIPQEEDDMAQRDVRDGLGQRSGLILPAKDGGYTYVEAFSDNTLDDGKQVKPFAPVTIRVAIEKSDGHWQTVSAFVVGRGPKDTAQPRNRIKLDDKNSVAVSVTRVTGDGTEPITICAY